MLDAAYAQLDELSRIAAEYATTLEDDPERLARIEQRRDLLFSLRRKHGETIADVLQVRNDAAAELDLIDTADLDVRVLSTRIGAAESALATLATELTDRRQAAAGRMAREVTRHLPDLGMPGAQFMVRLEPLGEVGADGAESVAFDVRLNQGMEPRPLARTASGGELSRLMLALKLVLARHDEVPSLVFDEVDRESAGNSERGSVQRSQGRCPHQSW